MNKILVIEDEVNINELIKYNLELKGYEVIQAFDGINGITMAYRQKPDLILLDIMIPKKDGYSVCSELRREGIKVPIIMLTAKSEEEDKVRGLDIGADDYIIKPFSIKELLSRVNANLRRWQELSQESKEKDDKEKDDKEESYSSGFIVDREAFVVTLNDTKLELTFKEYEILIMMMDNSNKVFSRNDILDMVWGLDYMGEIRTVDVHIRNLRRKMFEADNSREYIETVRGRGYRWKRN